MTNEQRPGLTATRKDELRGISPAINPPAYQAAPPPAPTSATAAASGQSGQAQYQHVEKPVGRSTIMVSTRVDVTHRERPAEPGSGPRPKRANWRDRQPSF